MCHGGSEAYGYLDQQDIETTLFPIQSSNPAYSAGFIRS
jgi:hypothetical protein